MSHFVGANLTVPDFQLRHNTLFFLGEFLSRDGFGGLAGLSRFVIRIFSFPGWLGSGWF
jgi:hypothetical protein